MKVLIIGGAGFIGFSLAKMMIGKGFEVDIFDSFSRGKKDDDMQLLMKNTNINIVNVDIKKLQVINNIGDDYDLIFHFAAILGVEYVINNPYMVLDENVLLTNNAIKIAKKQKSLKKFIFTSTSEVYAGTLQNNLLEIPTKETSKIILPDLNNPRSSYMLSKIYGEALCIHSGLPYVILRPHNIYGPRMGLSHVVPQIMKKCYKIENRQPLEVFSPSHTRTFCFIDTALEQIYDLIMCDDVINDTFNIGQEEPEIKISFLVEKIIKITKKDLEIKKMENTLGSPERRCPSMKKTYKFINNINEVPLEAGLQMTHTWYKKNNYFK